MPEAQARADGTPNAMAYECINQVRERAGLEPLQSGMSGEAFANAALKEHGWEVAGYFVALVTRRDDQMRMELLEQAFNERKANTAIEVAPGVMRKEKWNCRLLLPGKVKNPFICHIQHPTPN